VSEDRRNQPYRRVGDTAKCPARGVSMDPDAYRCPKCRIYFCFKCRRRVQSRDPQYQCMNQQCELYGKLLCNACIVEVPQMGDRSRQELVEAGKRVKVVPAKVLPLVFFIILVVSFGAGLNFGLPWWGGIVGGVIFATMVAGLLSNLTEYEQPVYRTVTENVEVGRSKCCIACKQAVEHIR
jgi:hypothetical protein